MFDAKILLIVIPALPLAAALLTAVLGKRVLRGRSHMPAVAAIAISCAASLLLVAQVHRTTRDDAGRVEIVRLWTWAEIDRAYASGEPTRQAAPRADAAWHDFHVEIALRADPLTAMMLATVTFVSLLVAVYSVGYMRGDPGYWRFFAYISLFVFSMTMLVSVSNFVLLYVFWEAVGLCSYLLIGFWFQKPEAAAAGKKAFLVNRIGDFGFALGVFLLWTTYGTLDFHDTPAAGGAVGTVGILGQMRLASPALFAGGWTATAICLLLFLGACGKSAQFPLHVWLPDAMEGPTPVSALIHAATMVTAGVYLVARCAPLFAASVDAQCVVAAVGGFTALLAALIALTQTDLKRILAYSTISQLGYMFLGLGAGSLMGITAGMFHLFTHAFFKALLFLGAGSVMHAMGGAIDLRQFGGLRRLPVTHWTFLFGCLALAGVFPWAGFWSKDPILAALHERAAGGQAVVLYRVLYAAALCGAFLTAAYTFRAYFLTFFGEERIPPEAGHHAHESPTSMTGPLVVLATCSLLVGGLFAASGAFGDFLHRTPSLGYVAAVAGEATETGESHLTVALLSQVVALAGVALAAALYLGSGRRAASLSAVMEALGLYQLSRGKFYFDQIYAALVVAPLRAFAGLSAWLDGAVIDGLVNLCGLVPKVVGAFLRPLQNGMIQFYALAMVLGLFVLLGALLM